MDAYKVISLVGEGSFGRVFKAKRRDTKEVVALKVIRKCGRTHKELLSLRSEFKIQKHLHHRNIIQMINSFETDKEIVVVTEFCKRDLHYILSKQNYLSEVVALPIVCDLVAALHYLHSNRVLHRDLKPQNVLVTEDGAAKLCDFGFARSMSRGTHVLTSIKGTPLYMAPELIEESPYDHNADLWSLGCIVYEMMVGTPPFTTTSILQLVRMIRYDPISWPSYLSDRCQNLLQGLLQKNPSQRLSWPHLLHHPFLQNKVSSSIESGISLPLTKELTSSQALAKEIQKLDLASKTDIQNQGLPQKIQHIFDSEKKLLREGACQTQAHPEPERGTALVDLEALEQKLSLLKATEHSELETENATQDEISDTTDDESARAVTPLETEEWLAFLQESMREVMAGDLESISEKSFITMVTNALTIHGATPKVSEYIATLLALPHVAPGVTESELASITSVYMEVKVVSSLMFAIKLLTHGPSCSASHDSVVEASKLTRDQLTAIERMLVLLNQLVHWNTVFLSQLCDVVTLLHLCPRFHLLLTLHKARPRISLDIVAILIHILRQMPENANIVDDSVRSEFSSGLIWYKVLKYPNKMLQTRICKLFQLMAQHCAKTFKAIWTHQIKMYIEALVYDSMMDLRCAAEELLDVVQDQQVEETVTQGSDDEEFS